MGFHDSWLTGELERRSGELTDLWRSLRSALGLSALLAGCASSSGLQTVNGQPQWVPEDGSRWVQVAYGEESDWYLDTETIVSTDYGTIQVWLLQGFLMRQRSGMTGRFFDSEQTRYEYDCLGLRARLLQRNVFLGDEVRDSEAYPEATWIFISPESLGELLLEAVCEIAETPEAGR